MMIKDQAKVMQNFTICLPKKIRKEMGISIKDTVTLVLKNGELTMKRAPSSWEELAKGGPDIFKRYGRAEDYLKQERSGWYE